MAEITMKINVGNDVDQVKLGQWIALGNELDTPFVGMTFGVTQNELRPAAIAVLRETHPQETLGADTVDQGADAPDDDQGTDAGVDASTANGAAPARRRGRRSNAEKAAEAAALAAVNGGQPAAAPLPGAPTPAAAGSMALPPGVSAPGAAAMAPPPPPSAPAAPPAPPPPPSAPAAPPAPSPAAAATPAAMPTSQIAAPANSDEVPLEVFRDALRQSQETNPGKISLLMRQATWPNGTPKAPCYTAESVPPADRVAYLNAMASL